MNTLSAILWNPDIEIFSIFGISIRYYSVLFVTGLSLAYWVIYKLYQDQKIPYEKFDSLFVYCLMFLGRSFFRTKICNPATRHNSTKPSPIF